MALAHRPAVVTTPQYHPIHFNHGFDPDKTSHPRRGFPIQYSSAHLRQNSPSLLSLNLN